jgi:hypothetical protein
LPIISPNAAEHRLRKPPQYLQGSPVEWRAERIADRRAMTARRAMAEGEIVKQQLSWLPQVDSVADDRARGVTIECYTGGLSENAA